MDQQDHRPESQPVRHFDHHRLDAWRIAFEATIEGDRISKAIPRGYGKLKDQLNRALAGAFTLTSEGAARTGADRACRFRWARAEAGEAAAVVELLSHLGIANEKAAQSVIDKLWRLSAMLTRLALPKR
jgi:four helix bundle protein